MSYLFLCNHQTQEECIEKGLFGVSEKFWVEVEPMQPGDRVLLYNVSTDTIYGPCKAAGSPRLNLDPYAFIESSKSYPAQAEVTWLKLIELRRGSRLLPFLRSELRCRLSAEETLLVYEAFLEAEGKKVSGWI